MKKKAKDRFLVHTHKGTLAPYDARFAILDGKDNWPAVAEVREEGQALRIAALLNAADRLDLSLAAIESGVFEAMHDALRKIAAGREVPRDGHTEVEELPDASEVAGEALRKIRRQS